jgi:voltage-gated sodium channel
VISLPALLTPLIDLQGFAVILILRIGRLFRLFRFMRFIPNRTHLAAGILRALKASLGVFAALAMINVMFSVGASLLFNDLAPEYFGNPMLSLYSIFKIFTVEGWYEIPDLIASRADHQGWVVFTRVYFVLSVLIGGILGLSLVNAVFVDEMTMDNNRDLEEKVGQLTEEIRTLRAEMKERR